MNTFRLLVIALAVAGTLAIFFLGEIFILVIVVALVAFYAALFLFIVNATRRAHHRDDGRSGLVAGRRPEAEDLRPISRMGRGHPRKEGLMPKPWSAERMHNAKQGHRPVDLGMSLGAQSQPFRAFVLAQLANPRTPEGSRAAARRMLRRYSASPGFAAGMENRWLRAALDLGPEASPIAIHGRMLDRWALDRG
jgi:hypothetical protein